MVMKSTRRPATWLKAGMLAACTGLVASIALPGTAQAGKECSAFTVTIRNAQGQLVGRTYPPDTKTTVRNIPANSVLFADGKFVEFRVDLDTLAVGRDVSAQRALLGYTLTGARTARADERVTDVRTTVFDSKVADVGAMALTGPLELEIREVGNGGLVLRRSGGGVKLKIQAKDCSQGGLFQMEPEPRHQETNRLNQAAGFRYCYQANAGAKRYFTNVDVLGYDSPEGTTTVVQGFSASAPNGIAAGFERRAVWSVMDGGRVGMVIGEDALEALLLEAPRARQACRNDLLD